MLNTASVVEVGTGSEVSLVVVVVVLDASTVLVDGCKDSVVLVLGGPSAPVIVLLAEPRIQRKAPTPKPSPIPPTAVMIARRRRR